MINSVIAGVISNVLTHVLLKTNRKPKNILDKRDSIRAIVDKATVNHVRANIKNSDVDDRLNNFLMSKEVVTVLSKIFIFDLSENYINVDEYNDNLHSEMDSRLGHFVRLERTEGRKAHPQKIFGEFKALFNLYYDSEYTEEEYKPREIFDCLFSACIDSLNLAIERGYINGLEATSILRHRILYGKLEQIERNIHFLTSSNKVPLLSIDELESKYIPLLKQRYSYIEPSGVDNVHRLPISSIYVEPDFNINMTEEKITLSDLSLHLTRQVILGDPGCGKTTLSRVLTHYFSTRERVELIIPFLITLREYGEVCNTQELSFIEYIVQQLKVSFQLDIADGVVEYLLVTGRAFVVFDGLDELMEVRYKKKMREKIESFSSLYPDTVVLVTSRKVGYSHAPLSDDQFQTLTYFSIFRRANNGICSKVV